LGFALFILVPNIEEIRTVPIRIFLRLSHEDAIQSEESDSLFLGHSLECQLSSSMMTDPVDRTDEFIQLFNRVEHFLSLLVRPEKTMGFAVGRGCFGP
jgi:hypothetical protein